MTSRAPSTPPRQPGFAPPASGSPITRAAKIQRRTASISTITAIAIVGTVTFPLLVVVFGLVDLARGYVRLPTVRLVAFAVAWAWLELAGIGAAALLWVRGRSGDHEMNFALQRWWTDRLIRTVTALFGLDISVSGADAIEPGPLVVLSRHASLADSLLTIWCLTAEPNLRPRVVLKRELLADPCLDVVGCRLPNYFVDRGAADSTPELEAIERLSMGMDSHDASIIFPEGTRSNPKKRARALERIRDIDPARADRLESLRHLIPPRPSGSHRLLKGSENADVLLLWHTGFEGMDSFGGIVKKLARQRGAVTVDMKRVPREEVPTDPEKFERWLDEAWCEMDERVDEMLGTSHKLPTV